MRSSRFPLLVAALLGVACAASMPGVSAGAEEGNAPTPKVIRGPASSLAPAPAGEGHLRWNDLDRALSEAKKANKPVLVDVVTDWCGWCRRMDKTTYGDPGVRDYIARQFVPARINAEDDAKRASYKGESTTYREFADGFRINRYPTTLFLAPDGQLITQVPGYVKPGTFLTVLRFVAEGAYRTQSWDDFAREDGAARP
jgi:thioredoxin-related protein